MKAISDAYLAASKRIDGHLSKIELMENLARLDGEENDITPARYIWISGALSIYVDDVQRFMLAHYYGIPVCSTVPQEPPDGMIFVSGEWEKQIRTNQLIAESFRIPASVV